MDGLVQIQLYSLVGNLPQHMTNNPKLEYDDLDLIVCYMLNEARKCQSIVRSD